MGIDLVDVQDVRDAMTQHGRRYLERIFTDRERREGGEHAEALALRLAAKEAALKVLRRGDEPLPWREIGFVADAPGPRLELTGAARAAADREGFAGLSVSVSHVRNTACAIVFADAERSAA